MSIPSHPEKVVDTFIHSLWMTGSWAGFAACRSSTKVFEIVDEHWQPGVLDPCVLT